MSSAPVNRLAKSVALAAVFTSLAFGQSMVSLGSSEPGSRVNQGLVESRRAARKGVQVTAKGMDPRVVVFTGDRVISQFVDGGGWLTSITVTNLETHSTSFSVFFFQDDGSDLNVPIVGFSGLSYGLDITLAPMGTFTFQTSGTNKTLSSGWALLSQTNSDSVGISAIFRQSVPGQQTQEAVVPAVNQFESHFLLNFDDTAYITGVALANPTLFTVAVVANIRNSQGQVVDTPAIQSRAL